MPQDACLPNVFLHDKRNAYQEGPPAPGMNFTGIAGMSILVRCFCASISSDVGRRFFQDVSQEVAQFLAIGAGEQVDARIEWCRTTAGDTTGKRH